MEKLKHLYLIPCSHGCLCGGFNGGFDGCFGVDFGGFDFEVITLVVVNIEVVAVGLNHFKVPQ